jgi:hypothetical protein
MARSSAFLASAVDGAAVVDELLMRPVVRLSVAAIEPARSSRSAAWDRYDMHPIGWTSRDGRTENAAP